MSRDAAAGESTPEDEAAHVQLRLDVGHDQVIEGWVRSDREFAAQVDEAEERLARLRGDADVLLALQLHGFEAAVWAPVGEELARYGYAVLMSWCRRGTILLRVHTLTGWQLPSSPYFTTHEQVGVVDDTVVRGLVRFQAILRDGRWDPRKAPALRPTSLTSASFDLRRSTERG